MSANINSTVTAVTSQIIEGAGKITLDGVDLGSFEGGVTIAYTPSWEFTKSEYAAGEIDGELMSSECMVSTTLEQNTARNMAVAMGGNTSSSSSSSSSVRYDFGPESGLNSGVLVVTGMSAMDKTQACRYTFGRVVRIAQVSQTLKKAAKQLLPVQFKCLLDTNNKYFTREEPIPLASL